MNRPLDYLPVWKKNATAAERFYELALMAEKHPDRFEKFIVLWESTKEVGRSQQAVRSDMTLAFALGFLELGKHNLLIEV